MITSLYTSMHNKERAGDKQLYRANLLDWWKEPSAPVLCFRGFNYFAVKKEFCTEYRGLRWMGVHTPPPPFPYRALTVYQLNSRRLWPLCICHLSSQLWSPCKSRAFQSSFSHQPFLIKTRLSFCTLPLASVNSISPSAFKPSATSAHIN